MATPPMRRDAELNNARLLTSARTLFAERGLNVGLNEIAQHAQVGVGTAYRHFPSKEALIETLLQQRQDAITQAVDTALAEPDAWTGVVELLDSWVQLHMTDPALTCIFNDPEFGSERLEASKNAIAPQLDTLAERARTQHTVRSDFTGSDIFFIQVAALAIAERSRTVAPHTYRRYLTMMLEGVRAYHSHDGPLPHPPLTRDQTHLLCEIDLPAHVERIQATAQ